MVIFHSYVKLPEGISPVFWVKFAECPISRDKLCIWYISRVKKGWHTQNGCLKCPKQHKTSNFGLLHWYPIFLAPATPWNPRPILATLSSKTARGVPTMEPGVKGRPLLGVRSERSERCCGWKKECSVSMSLGSTEAGEGFCWTNMEY